MADTVLVVEDDPDIRDALSQLLDIEGYHVIAARNGREGIDALSKSDRPGVILLDIMMPQVDGWGVLDEMERNPHLRGIPVIVISAFLGQAKSLSAAALIGRPVRFFNKPVDMKALLRAVRRHMATESRRDAT